MKIECLEVPEPSYLPLLWPAEWKAPASFNITTINSENKMITDFELLVDCLPIILQAQCPISVLALQATFPILPWVTVFHFIETESDHCHSLTVPGADEKVLSKVLDAVS